VTQREKPYLERLRVPSSWWVLSGVGVLAVFLAYDAALGVTQALAAAGLLALACAVWLTAQSAKRVCADESGLQVGRASLPSWAIGEVAALDTQATARARGPEADPHAFFALAGYVATSVRVQVADPADPVPYWLVSTRHPDALAAAVVAARDAGA
jgi:hypothetical protein